MIRFTQAVKTPDRLSNSEKIAVTNKKKFFLFLCLIKLIINCFISFDLKNCFFYNAK